MAPLSWPQFFRLPQTQLLLLGTLVGYSSFLWILGPRPLPLLSGGLITIATVGAWATTVRKELAGRQDNLLERDEFRARITVIEQKVTDRSHKLWQQAKSWSFEIQDFANQIATRIPSLTPELLETLYTTLVLTEQLADKLSATRQVKTKAYQSIAQQQLQAQYARLRDTHHQLQSLHDQAVLLSSESGTPPPSADLPAQLRLVIAANRVALQAQVQDS